MKKLLLLLTTMMALILCLFSACTPKTTEETTPTIKINEQDMSYTQNGNEIVIVPTAEQWAGLNKDFSQNGLVSMNVGELPVGTQTFTITNDSFWFADSGARMQVNIQNVGSVVITDKLFKKENLTKEKVDTTIDLGTLLVSGRMDGKELACEPSGTYAPYLLHSATNYTVKEGDTLEKIAKYHGTTVQILTQQNAEIGEFTAGKVINVAISPTDYSNSSNWVNLPITTKDVDIFYLYPTVWFPQPGDPTMASIESGVMTGGAAKMMEEQAMLFSDIGNIYAPYYRQTSVDYMITLEANEHIRVLSGIPATDVVAAFDYYIKNYNKGKPFIIVGHSQGSNAMLYLLADYMGKNKEVNDCMVAAYALGYSVTKPYLNDNPHLKFAASANDTGVIISYNTEAPNLTEKSPVVLPDSIAINPLSWTTTAERADESQNLGELKVDATVNLQRGTVECSTVNPEDYKLPLEAFPLGVYHACDFAFYRENLRLNAIERVAEEQR